MAELHPARLGSRTGSSLLCSPVGARQGCPCRSTAYCVRYSSSCVRNNGLDIALPHKNENYGVSEEQVNKASPLVKGGRLWSRACAESAHQGRIVRTRRQLRARGALPSQSHVAVVSRSQKNRMQAATEAERSGCASSKQSAPDFVLSCLNCSAGSSVLRRWNPRALKPTARTMTEAILRRVLLWLRDRMTGQVLPSRCECGRVGWLS